MSLIELNVGYKKGYNKARKEAREEFVDWLESLPNQTDNMSKSLRRIVENKIKEFKGDEKS